MTDRNTSIHFPSIKEAGRQLVSLRRLGRLEKKVHGFVSARTQQMISEALAAAEALLVVEDARAASRSKTDDV